MTIPGDDRHTLDLLQRWHGGERGALDELLRRDLPWIEQKVRARLGAVLRKKGETIDYVQDAMIELLRYGPRFEMQNRAHFRALIARIVENVLRGKRDWFEAQRRRIAQERPLQRDSVVRFDPAASQTTPSMAADRDQEEALLRLALELLDPEDQEVLVLRQWEKLSFAAIAERLGVTQDAARMRFHRTLPKVAVKMRLLRGGDVDALVADSS